MRILFTSHRFSPDIGGIEVNSEILARYFASQNHEVCLVTQSVGGGDSAYPFAVRRRPTTKELFALHRWADVVYQNNIELGSLWPVFFTRKPTVISVRTWIRANDGRVRPVDLLKKWVLSRADAVIAISEAIRRDSCDSAVVIGNPYRSKLFRVVPGVRRRNSVAFLGRFVSDKGVDLLIRAYAEVKDDAEGLTLIGAGPEETSLRRLASELGVEASFTGPLEGEDLVQELNRHAILAVPSRWPEPFGNVALEGMACGCVVVGSDGGGLPDAIGKGGLTFKRGEAGSLATQLGRLLRSPHLLETLRDAGKGHLASRREEVVCHAYLNRIQGVISK
jgi:glycosyltransferase involved in cell wall biosynthesis